MQTHPKPTLTIITCPSGRAGATLMARDRAAQIGRNFRAPHHTAGVLGVVGEIAIAAGGVLYLDEPAELGRSVANYLRSTVAMMHLDVRPEIILAIRAPDLDDPRSDLGRDLARIGELFSGWEITSHRTPPAPPPPTLQATMKPEVSEPMGRNEAMDRNEAIKKIKAGLKKRSGKTWSVTGGRGTAWGWIKIEAPPRRRTSNFDGTAPGDHTTPEEREELAALLGLESIHPQGHNIAASTNHYREYVDRAEGREPSVCGKPYWD